MSAYHDPVTPPGACRKCRGSGSKMHYFHGRNAGWWPAPRLGSCPECGGMGTALLGPELPPPILLTFTPAHVRLTLKALEIRMSDLTERAEVLAAGEVCNLLRASLGMETRAYWDDSD
ncbi:hypothetical protein Q0M94_19910 (plasmid) [Deinococcus radiomollis]|uniref:hypothetical protein n=1 Tax=Deinococcus radiomollis TaxID=468916 RepID=UPI0038912900